jgi:DNA-binding GntR family transcriptional regulator
VLLAHHLYNLLENPEPPDDLAAAAIDLALDETRDAQQALWDDLGRVERIVLMALADGQAVTGNGVAGEHRVARSTLREALDRLLADERHVQRNEEGTPFLLDPLLAEWLRRR